nr:wall-associated receptor kinase-like 1 [Ipomoea batatas]
MMMRSAGKEIVVVVIMLMMSFTMMTAEYEIPWKSDRYDRYEGHKEIYNMVPRGCRNKCGNVSIFYPFGIGPKKNCYLNKWFLINCTNTSDGVEKPFLSSFSDEKDGVREILRISYELQTITMKEWFSPLCQTTTGSANLSVMRNTKLSGAPFFYSSSANRFMFYGCGTAVLTTPGQEFIQSSCKLTCRNNTTPAPKFVDSCNGINCCRLRFDYDVSAYQINITTHSSIVNACNYAFFLATPSSRFSLSNLPPEEKVVVPVVWRWIIKRYDFNHLPPHYSIPCYSYEDIFPPQPRGTNWNCHCNFPEKGNVYLPNGCQAWDDSWALGEKARLNNVPKGCQDKCGTINIYYPFGIGNGGSKSCYLNKWFLINCTQSSDGSEKPYLNSISGGVEILGMSYESQTITVKEPISPSCQTTEFIKGSNFSQISNTKLSASPFFYTIGNNFMLFGCGNAFITMAGEELERHGYKLKCSKNTAPKTAYDCHGINCHYLTFDYDVNTYQVNFTHDSSINAACNYAFFLSASSSLPTTLQSLPSRQQEVVFVPVELRWTITEDDVPPSYFNYCSPSTNINPQLQRHNYLQCDCGIKGRNAYFSDGCEQRDIDDKISSNKMRPAIIGVSASFGFVLLIWACVILYKAIKKRKMKKLREKFFKRNGGLLLQQQLLAKEGIVEKTKIFTATELDKATDHFNVDRIVGRGQKPISFELDDDENRSLVSRFLLCMEENRLMEILDVQVIEQGKKEDVVAMAWLAQRCLNLNGKKRPTMKEVSTELDAIKASHSHLPLAMEALEIESDFIA